MQSYLEAALLAFRKQIAVRQTVFNAILLSLALSVFISCGKSPDKPKYSSTDSVLIYISETMNEMYLWNTKMTKVDWKEYTDPEVMMRDMIYTPVDRWSHVYSKSKLKSFFTGESLGFGFRPEWEGELLMVASVSRTSEAYRAGLRRGYRISRINGRFPQGINDWSFFNDPQFGETMSITAVSEKDTVVATISAVSVVSDQLTHFEVINKGAKKCGYIVYESFTSASSDSLLSVMEDFRVLGVSELIIDLRYNGGGETSVLMDWMTKIMPARFSGKPFFITKHNSKVSYLNKAEQVFPSATSLGVERVFVISTSSTASASEALINGLKPYIEVHHIGDRTHGKPVGMYVYELKDWYVVPITFEYTNALGEGGFYNGIEPEYYAYDNKRYDWGDSRDNCLGAALTYISTGSYPNTAIASNLKSSRKSIVPVPELGFYSLPPVQLGK